MGALLLYGGWIISLVAWFIVLIHAFKKSVMMGLLFLLSPFILGGIAGVVGLPTYLKSLVANLYCIYYLMTKYEKESKGFVVYMYFGGILLSIIGGFLI